MIKKIAPSRTASLRSAGARASDRLFLLFLPGTRNYHRPSIKLVRLKSALEAFLRLPFPLLVRGATRRDAFFLPASRGLVPSPLTRFNGWMYEFLIERAGQIQV
jgi:hypothetical protein